MLLRGAPAATSAQTLLRLRRAATRRPSRSCDARRAARHRGRRRRSPTAFDFATRRLRRARCSTRRPTARCIDYRALRASARTRPDALVVVAADLLALTLLDAARASSAPTSPSAARSASACRSATAARTPRSSPRKDEFVRKMPGPHHRRVAGRARQAGAAHGAADARAAHPPREGDEQHLHGAGAAGGRRQHVRRLPRARGAPRDRRARARR